MKDKILFILTVLCIIIMTYFSITKQHIPFYIAAACAGVLIGIMFYFNNKGGRPPKAS